jgi:dihydrofolate reductase
VARLLYSGISSLDGYVADVHGSFSWAEPDEEVHAFVDDLQRPVGTYLFGRRLYEVMRAWETIPTTGSSPAMADFAEQWHDADKVVYSRTLDAVETSRTRLEREFDVDAVRRWKATADRDLLVGGPGLAAVALAAGLVDEVSQLVCPVVVGGGTRFLAEGLRLDLELRDIRRFRSGVVHLSYAVAT